MLPPYIIEQIRKREEELVREQPVLQLPLPDSRRPRERPQQPAEDGERGVIIIDLG